MSWIVLLSVVALTASGCAAFSDNGPDGPTRTITDVKGRDVEVPEKIDRVLTDGAFLIYSIVLLDPQDPLRTVVGMPDDFEQNDPDALEHYRAQFPQIDDIPRIGNIWDGSFSVETAIKLKPQVFLISASSWDSAQDAGIIDDLEAAGIPTLVFDYFVDPIDNTIPTMRMLGELLGYTEQAEAFIGHYESVVNMVESRLEDSGAPPTPTFLWRAPGYFDCCSSLSKSNLAQLVTFAGGANIADDYLTTAQGSLTPEAVITANPAVIVATGANWASSTPAKPGSFVPLGYAQEPETAQSQLEAVVAAQPGFEETDAVADGRVYAVWHHFYNTPFNYLTIAWFAKWLHPELFADVDPDAQLAELHEKFLPVPMSGTFWTSLMP